MPLEREGADPVNGGLVTGVAPHTLGAAESPDCTNTDPTDQYGMSTRNPSAFYTGAAFPASSQNSGMTTGDVYIHPIGGRVYVRGASIIMQAGEDGGFSSIAASTSVANATRMGVAFLYQTTASFTSAQFSLIVTDTTVPLLFNEVTLAVTTASMASTGMNCEWTEVYERRVFVGGRRDSWFGNYVSHSALNDVTDWNTANNAGAFYVGGPDRVIQAKATRNGMYFFKRNSVLVLTGTSPFDYEVVNVTENVGLIAPRGVATDGQGVYFASDDGIYYANGLNITRVSDKVRASYLAIPDKTKIAMAYRGEKLYVLYNSSSTNPNDKMFVAAPRRKLESGDTQAIWANWASQPFGALAVGGPFQNLVGVTVSSTFFVFALDVPYDATQPSTPSAVPSIAMTYNTPHWDFRDPESKKQGVFWNMHVRPTNATQTWTAQLKTNGASVATAYSISIASGASHAYAGRAAAGWEGRYLSLELTSIGRVTLYGVGAYAEVQSEGDYPRLES